MIPGRGAAAVLLVLLAAATTATAAPTAEERQAEYRAAAQAAFKASTAGPADIALADQAVLKLPAGMRFIPHSEADGLMVAMGNTASERTLGLVTPAGDEGDWLVLAEFQPAGYIKEDDAKDWNVDELFKQLKEGTEEANKMRAERGIPALEVLGWIEKPRYDAATHRLVWSMAARNQGETDEAQQGVNYITSALGRDGYISLDLITGRPRIEADKAVAQTLLSALQYKDGKRYADFNAKTDHVAEYGLAALVAGVAAKKLGFFALAAAFGIKFAKLIAIGVAAVGATFAKLFHRKPAA